MNVRGKKVFVGLSGGVDSAVSAALLKEAGAEVTGVFIKGWYPPDMPCTWAAERRDAMRVAARLHIPFLTFDASAEYKKGVIEYLLSEYRAGRTPNPDVMCNREVKFGAFYRFAMAERVDAIAMGHYRNGEKDQSYFLWAVPKDILEATIFPVGSMEKKEVRALAKKFNLPVAEKKDSQGICFLGAVSVKEFLEKEFGNDNPALLYTIGQRVEGGYVIGKDIVKKELIVSRRQPRRQESGLRPEASEEQRTVTEIQFRNSNWFSEPIGELEAQTRYRGPRISVEVRKVSPYKGKVTPYGLFEIPAPGQSIVFYRDDELVGGGIIAE